MAVIVIESEALDKMLDEKLAKFIPQAAPKESLFIPDDVEVNKEAAAKIFAAHYTEDKVTARSKVLARIKTITESKMHMTMGDIRFYIENNSRFI